MFSVLTNRLHKYYIINTLCLAPCVNSYVLISTNHSVLYGVSVADRSSPDTEDTSEDTEESSSDTEDLFSRLPRLRYIWQDTKGANAFTPLNFSKTYSASFEQ